MSLDASTLNYGIPFILSDLLWSSEDVAVPAIIPGMHPGYRLSLLVDGDMRPACLAQKMFIVSNKICIVFCGASNEISVFIEVFKITFAPGAPISNDRIHQFLQAYRLGNNFKESAFFITYIQNRPGGGVTVNQFYCPQETHIVDIQQFQVDDTKWNILEEEVYEKTSASGSGAAGFLNLIRQPVEFDSRFPKGHFMRALQTNTVLIAKLLSLQITADYTVPDHWGGGFEAAFYDGIKFRKVDNIAYIFCHSQFTPEGDVPLPIPRIIMHYRYVKEVLYITTLEVYKYLIDETGPNVIFTTEQGQFHRRVFVVAGIDVENLDAAKFPTDFSFRTNMTAVGYSLITPDNTIFNPAFFNLGPAVTINFQENRSLTVTFDKRIVEDVRMAAEGRYPRLNEHFGETE